MTAGCSHESGKNLSTNSSVVKEILYKIFFVPNTVSDLNCYQRCRQSSQSARRRFRETLQGRLQKDITKRQAHGHASQLDIEDPVEKADLFQVGHAVLEGRV